MGIRRRCVRASIQPVRPAASSNARDATAGSAWPHRRSRTRPPRLTPAPEHCSRYSSGQHAYAPGDPYGRYVLTVILALIIVFIAVGIIGFVVHGLFWLFIVAAILFVASLVFGGRHAGRQRRSRV